VTDVLSEETDQPLTTFPNGVLSRGLMMKERFNDDDIFTDPSYWFMSYSDSLSYSAYLPAVR
jgi:hypothetical protein